MLNNYSVVKLKQDVSDTDYIQDIPVVIPEAAVGRIIEVYPDGYLVDFEILNESSKHGFDQFFLKLRPDQIESVVYE
jgi:hypothetical protein